MVGFYRSYNCGGGIGFSLGRYHACLHRNFLGFQVIQSEGHSYEVSFGFLLLLLNWH
jgi:hypothetical protein